MMFSGALAGARHRTQSGVLLVLSPFSGVLAVALEAVRSRISCPQYSRQVGAGLHHVATPIVFFCHLQSMVSPDSSWAVISTS